MRTRRTRTLTTSLLILAVALSAATALLPGADPGRLGTQAQTQLDRHNYKSAAELAEKALNADPPAETVPKLKTIRGIALCRLHDPKAAEYVRQAMKDHPPLEKDPDLWMALGVHLERSWPRTEAFEAFHNAAKLYAEADRDKEAAEAYMKAAEQYLRDQNIVVAQQADKPDWDWQRRRKESIDKAIELFKEVLTLDVPAETKATALYRAGEAAMQIGDRESADRAIDLWRRCVADYPKTDIAVHAQMHVANTLQRFEEYVEAVKAYRKVWEDYPDRKDQVKAARQQVESIEAPQIHLGVTKPCLPGEKAEIYWRIRNVRKLHLDARPVDLTEFVRKTDLVHPLNDLAAVAGRVAAQWQFETPDEGAHHWYAHNPPQRGPDEQKQTTVAINVPLEGPAAYVVTARGTNADGKETKAHCLVVFSRLAAVAKADADQTLIFADDTTTGNPATGADAAVARYWRTRNKERMIDRDEGKVNDAGLVELKTPRREWHQWMAAVKDGEHQALCASSSYRYYWWGYRQSHFVYGFTDRPVYRPGDTVHFKEIVRRNMEGEYRNLPNTKVRVEIRNPKNEVLYSKDLITDEFGAIEGDLTIPDDAPLGLYPIHVTAGGQRIYYHYSQGNRFRVEEYRKPEFKVTVEPGQPDYRVGEEMKLKIGARYYFGEPVVGAQVNFRIRKQSYSPHYDWPRPWGWYFEKVFYGRTDWRPWWRPQFDELVANGTVETDENGEAFVTVQAKPIENHEKLDLKFVVEAEVTDASRRVIRGSGEVKVTHAPYFIYPKPAQQVYGPGDSVEINVRTEDPNGKPIAGEFDVQAWRIERVRNVVEEDGEQRVEFEEKLAQKVFQDEIEIPETGRGSLRFTPDMTGRFRIIVTPVDKPAGEDVRVPEGTCELWIASKIGAEAHYAYNALQIVPSSDQYEIGETMKVLVNTSKENSRVLLTGEADVLLFHRVVHVKKNSALVKIPVETNLCPNFTLTATLLRDNTIFRDDKKIVVPPTHQFLDVKVQLGEGSKGGGEDNKYQPREEVPVHLTVTDVRNGKPVEADLALFMVDSSVYYIQPEFRENIAEAFYGYTRQVRVATTDSYAGPPSLAPPVGVPYPVQGRRGRWLAGAQGAMPAEAAAMDAAPAVRKSADRAAEGEQLAEPVVRENFADTVLWAGSVRTDADGTATVTATLPDQLTTFALHAVAADKESRVGQSESDVIATKRIIVRLQTGRFFTEGDRSYVTVLAHNYYDDPQDVKVDLSAEGGLEINKVWRDGTWADYEPGEALDLSIEAGGERRIDFLTRAVRPGEVAVTARALSRRESDAIKLTMPILEWGARKIVADGGSLRDGDDAQQDAFTFTVPEEIKPGSQQLTVTLNPSIAAVAMESLPFLADYPYGCVEQTMSRFMPTVLVRRTLSEAGVDLDAIREHIEQEARKDPKLAAKWEMLLKRHRRNPVYSGKEIDRMVAAGLKRLADMQHGDGGWGWWKNSRSNPYMTAYVLYGLSIARESDVKVPDNMIERATDWLIAEASKPVDPDANWWRRHVYNDHSRAYMLYVIGRVRPAALKQAKLAGHLDRIYEDRDELSDYGRALLALALHADGDRERARIVVENFQNTVTIDEKENTAHWGRTHGWWYWYHGGEETTAWVLQAMLTVLPDHEYVPQAVNWLVQNRRELRWHNTKTTAMVVHALMRYARHAGELDCDQTFEIVIDDAVRRTVRVTKENLFTFDDWVTVDAASLPPGEHTLTVRRKGRGNLYWGAYVRYFTTAERIEGGGNRLTLARRYYRLVPEEFTNTRTVWRDGERVTEKFPDFRYNREPLEFGAEITSGEMIDVEISIDAAENLEYMIFEDPKPAGCEPYRLTSGSTYGGGQYANMELRDTKIVFFADWVSKGERTLTYRLVCEQPGTFRVLPSDGEAMYTPFIEAISDSGKLTITTKPQKAAD